MVISSKLFFPTIGAFATRGALVERRQANLLEIYGKMPFFS
jgi:hypothetical protein